MGRKILLADDSITIQKVVNLTFSDEGIEVVTVGNGELAVRKMSEVRPDIVLADVYMPGKTGYEVCEYVKTNPQFSHIPVLLLVGAFEPFDPSEATRVKADGHLTKPFESRALVATVSKLLANAPAAATPPPPTPPVANLPLSSPSPWQPIASDAATTKLSPEIAARYQASFANDQVDPFKSNPAFPIQASPVPPMQSPIQASPVTPIQASPVPPMQSPIQASPVPPIQASPVFSESFTDKTQEGLPPFPGFASPVNPPSIPEHTFSFDNYDFNNPPIAAAKEPEPEHVEVDRGPVFDLDAPPPSEPTFELDINDISYNTSEQKAQSTLVFDPAKEASEPAVSTNETFSLQENIQTEPEQEMNLDFQDDQYEATKIMGSPFRKKLEAAYSSSPEPEIETPQPTDVSEDAGQNAPTEIGYDDFTPLDLEPLDEVSYQSEGHTDNVLDDSSHAEDTSNISEVNVFEPLTADIKKEPLLDMEEMSTESASYSSDEAVNTGRITGSHLARITESIPQLSNAVIHQDAVVHQEPIAPPPLPETPVVESSTYDLENATSPLDVDESPSQFELEQAPSQYYSEETSAENVLEEPLADLVTMPEQEQHIEATYNPLASVASAPPSTLEEVPQHVEPTYNPLASVAPAPPSNLEIQQPFENEEEMTPTTEIMASAPVLEESTESIETLPQTPTQETISSFALVSETPTMRFQPIAREKEYSQVETPPTQPALTITNIEQIPQPLIDEIARRVVESTPVLSQPAPVAAPITSIEQIPQHLVDEIVRRAISQISEAIVREIVWEVVPDLAEILIKKQLEKIK